MEDSRNPVEMRTAGGYNVSPNEVVHEHILDHGSVAMNVIDVHTHVWLAKAEENRCALMEAVEEVPLARLYASGLHGRFPDVAEVKAINDAVHKLMQDCPRARGQAYLNPRHGEKALDELKRCLDLGFTGIKLWVATRADNEANFPIYEAAIRHSLPVLLHCFSKAHGQQPFETRPGDFADAARRYPECTFIMAHVAGDFIAGCECVAGLDNAYVDISGTYGEKGMVEYAVERLGAEHVLFGTDMPGSDFYHNLGKVTGADITEEATEMVLHKNAERIFS